MMDRLAARRGSKRVVVKEFRKHFNAKPNAGFAIGKVSDIKQTCLTERNIKIYMVKSTQSEMLLSKQYLQFTGI